MFLSPHKKPVIMHTAPPRFNPKNFPPFFHRFPPGGISHHEKFHPVENIGEIFSIGWKSAGLARK